MNKLLKVRCPNCKTSFSYYESEFRPFCSERCKMIDLGHWFEESYKVPLKEHVELTKESDEYEDDENFQENNEESDNEH